MERDAVPASTRRSPYRPGRITRILLWCGGVDRDLLVTRLEHYRYVNLGLFVVLVALLGGVSFTLYAAVIAQRFSPLILPFALLWACVVFALDRSIVAEPSYGNLDMARFRRLSAPHDTGTASRIPDPGPSPRKYSRGSAYAFRIAVALMVAYLIGEAILLVVFRPEITAQIAQRQAAQFQIAAAAPVQAKQDLITGLKEQLAGEQRLRDDAQKRLDTATTNLQIERRAGNRARIRAARAEQAAALENNTTVDAASHGRDAVTTQKIAGLQSQIEAIRRGDPNAVADDQLLAGQRATSAADSGWVEQEAALTEYLARNGTSPTVGAVPWIVRGILFSIELVPLVLKLASGSTIYGQRQRDRADHVRYRDAADEAALIEHIDRMSEVDRAHSTSMYELAMERRRFHLDTGLTYLGQQRNAMGHDEGGRR